MPLIAVHTSSSDDLARRSVAAPPSHKISAADFSCESTKVTVIGLEKKKLIKACINVDSGSFISVNCFNPQGCNAMKSAKRISNVDSPVYHQLGTIEHSICIAGGETPWFVKFSDYPDFDNFSMCYFKSDNSFIETATLAEMAKILRQSSRSTIKN